MKVWYSGFNLYNQISESKELLIEDFTLYEYNTFDNIILDHTYILLQSASKIEFCGAINKNICIKETKDVEKVVCANNTIFILYKNGSICRIDSATAESKLIPNFLRVEDSDDYEDRIVNIACGKTVGVAVSEKNKIFNIPNKLKYDGRKITQLAAGHEHCLVLDSNGDIYSFGCGIRGQLGHGVLQNETDPKQIDALAGIKIVQIAAGGWHSCAISSTGDLYTWGWNSEGQLGLLNQENASVYATPQPVCFDDLDCNVTYVACGTKHTVVIIENRLYGAGWNKYKQLGNINSKNINEFKLLKDLYKEKVISLKCGTWCTIVITE